MNRLSSLALYLVRHGECEHNLHRRIGAQDDTPLTEHGREQARANGRLLREMGLDFATLDFISSPLHRTCVTMELLRIEAGLSVTGYRADRRIMEIDFGDDTGKTIREIAERTTGGFGEANWDYVRTNGESVAMAYARVGRFLDTLTRDSVIVTHAGIIRLIRGRVLNLSRSGMLDHHPPNAGILRLAAGTEAAFGI
jgi:broad specificity phosphatase PhoE